jgi:hypothetical protein
MLAALLADEFPLGVFEARECGADSRRHPTGRAEHRVIELCVASADDHTLASIFLDLGLMA